MNSGLSVTAYENGPLRVNTYLVSEDTAGVIIDPGSALSELIELLDETGLRIEAILLTHGHLDHVAGAAEIKKRTGAPVMMHADDVAMTRDLAFQSRYLMMKEPDPFTVDRIVEDGDVLDLLQTGIECIRIGGHSSGSLCYLIDTMLFSGDTLFNYTVGRTDLLGGTSQDEVQGSRQGELLERLEDSGEVYQGHGTATTNGFEKQHNIRLQEKYNNGRTI